MSKPEINFTFFSSVIIRTPAYPIDFYKNLTNDLSTEPDKLKELLKNPQLNEALYLASSELFSEIQKWQTEKNFSIDKSEKISFAVLKYLIRMSTRCTPFGLFASCGYGRLSNHTKINIEDYTANLSDKKYPFYRKTRLDMQLICNVLSELGQNTSLQEDLLFYPNTTLYQLGDFYRYIEYTLEKNKRKYSLEALKKSDYLDLIIQAASIGKKKKDLAGYLVNDEININEALEFVEELISNQILVSELEPKLTGSSFLNDLKNKTDTKIEIISKEVENMLLKIDSNFTNDISLYEEMSEVLTKSKFSFDKKYLFQTDLFLNSNDFQLDKKYTAALSKTIDLLDSISEKPKQTSLEKFKKAFIERYENEAVSLVKALDVETGLGYLQDSAFDSTPLLDTIEIKPKNNTEYQINLNRTEKIIYDKLQNALQNNKTNIQLSYNDFKNEKKSTQKMPITFSCVFEIIEENEKEWIVIQSIGGSSAANLLARFCYGNSEINSFVNEITQFECDSNNDKIIAEIIHLPESRTGNVLRRPSFRTYEIPYLGQSNLEISNQIHIEDLLLFVKNNRLVLWSKKYDKEVVPRLTNAHNYSYNALPVYHFLCDMQFENCKSAIGISEKFEKLFDYIPRITIGNCIISKAKWLFSKNKHTDFFNILTSKNKFNPEIVRSALISMNIKKEIQYVSLIDGDNTLVINLANDTCLKMLVNAIKNRTQFILEEFLFPSNKAVKGEKGVYSNQFIAGLKNNQF
ncbi:lantibiotic dehydratase family protein [Flavobacterium gelatinilyticum]|uniref:lantibiotic dehydratase family protein n=1 Tax=Flavobacterium gelatinilyticum TaxID=3003260 RepID=UPI00248068F5|nr:lantibiotic dehydratase family protein [Flavobacterium gelatinilyticum]